MNCGDYPDCGSNCHKVKSHQKKGHKKSTKAHCAKNPKKKSTSKRKSSSQRKTASKRKTTSRKTNSKRKTTSKRKRVSKPSECTKHAYGDCPATCKQRLGYMYERKDGKIVHVKNSCIKDMKRANAPKERKPLSECSKHSHKDCPDTCTKRKAFDYTRKNGKKVHVKASCVAQNKFVSELRKVIDEDFKTLLSQPPKPNQPVPVQPVPGQPVPVTAVMVPVNGNMQAVPANGEAVNVLIPRRKPKDPTKVQSTLDKINNVLNARQAPAAVNVPLQSNALQAPAAAVNAQGQLNAPQALAAAVNAVQRVQPPSDAIWQTYMNNYVISRDIVDLWADMTNLQLSYTLEDFVQNTIDLRRLMNTTYKSARGDKSAFTRGLEEVYRLRGFDAEWKEAVFKDIEMLSEFDTRFERIRRSSWSEQQPLIVNLLHDFREYRFRDMIKQTIGDEKYNSILSYAIRGEISNDSVFYPFGAKARSERYIASNVLNERLRQGTLFRYDLIYEYEVLNGNLGPLALPLEVEQKYNVFKKDFDTLRSNGFQLHVMYDFVTEYGAREFVVNYASTDTEVANVEKFEEFEAAVFTMRQAINQVTARLEVSKKYNDVPVEWLRLRFP